MVTAAVALVALLAQGEAALAARRSGFDPFGDLFAPQRTHRTRHRATVHAPTAPTAAVRTVDVPLPQPRPAEAPQKPAAVAAKPAAPEAVPAAKSEPDKKQPDNKPAPDKPVEQAAPIGPPAPQPSACRLALTEDIAIAPSIPAIHGPGACGGDDLVRLEAVVLPDKHQVSLSPAATLRCGMAAAIADWVRTDIAPFASQLGSEVATLDNFDSFECRGRNGIAGAPLSEHGRANALDVHAFRLADGRSIALTDRDVPRSFREDVLHSACTRFMTVLGPGSDWYHEDHIHIDLMERHNNYKICQWNVWDPMPQTAPLLPEKRPDGAPPRVVAGKGDDARPDAAGKPDAAASPSVKPGAAEGDAPDPDEQARAKNKSQNNDQAKSATARSTPDKPATKKRRSNRRS
jgi:hypothetical protein